MISLKKQLIKLPVWSHYNDKESYVYINPKLIVAVKEQHGVIKTVSKRYCIVETSTKELDIENDESSYIVMNSQSYNIALTFEELSDAIDQWYINKNTTKYIEGVVNEK